MHRECRERLPCHRGLAIPRHARAWSMPGLLTIGFLWSQWRGKRSRHSRCMHNPQFFVSGKRSIGLNQPGHHARTELSHTKPWHQVDIMPVNNYLVLVFGSVAMAKEQGKSEGFHSCDRRSNLTQIGFNRRFFNPCDLEIRWMTLKNYRAPLIHHIRLCIISKPSVNQNWSYSPESINSGKNRRFFVPCDHEIWRMTLKNDRALLLCCFKLCASFDSHQ